MALAAATVVRLPKPASLSFGEAMNQHRVWLDTHKIQPTAFKPAYYNGVVGFEIGFRNQDEAARFDKQFG